MAIPAAFIHREALSLTLSPAGMIVLPISSLERSPDAEDLCNQLGGDRCFISMATAYATLAI